MSASNQPLMAPGTVLARGVEDGIEWCTMAHPKLGTVSGYVRLTEVIPQDDPTLWWNGPVLELIPGGRTYGPDPDGWIGFGTQHQGAWPLLPLKTELPEGATIWTTQRVAETAQALAKAVAKLYTSDS